MKKLLVLFLLLSSFAMAAQNFLSWKYNDRYFSVLLGTGSTTYFGELNHDNAINDRFSLITAGIEARLLNRVSARAEFNYLTMDGSDQNAPDSSFERQRNLSFESRNFQFHIDGIYYLKPYRGDYHKRWIFDPYLVAGVGYLQYNPAARLGEERYLLREAQTEGEDYNKWAFTIPFGFGAKFRINEFVNINFEVLYHLAFTDYLDDVSNTYATELPNSTAEFLSDRKDEIGVINPEIYDQIQPGSPRGDSSDNDRFMLINIKVEVFIPPEFFQKKQKR
ncbi:MAG: DUF6089 family protein [Bacteroidota bacterium]